SRRLRAVGSSPARRQPRRALRSRSPSFRAVGAPRETSCGRLSPAADWTGRVPAGDAGAMKFTHLGRSGLSVSRICLGTMNFGWLTSQPDSFKIMDTAHEQGINFFD